MSEPTRIGGEEMRAALFGLARAWIAECGRRASRGEGRPAGCDFCGVAFEDARVELREYVDWCMQLGRLWKRPGQPPPKVFCNDCALGAIPHLLDGTPYERREARA